MNTELWMDYKHRREIPGRGLCGIMPMAFTWGLFLNIDQDGNYWGRFCFPDLRSALDAISSWDGVNDPPGDWIAFKAAGKDYYNQEWKKRTNYIE